MWVHAICARFHAPLSIVTVNFHAFPSLFCVITECLSFPLSMKFHTWVPKKHSLGAHTMCTPLYSSHLQLLFTHRR